MFPVLFYCIQSKIKENFEKLLLITKFSVFPLCGRLIYGFEQQNTANTSLLLGPNQGIAERHLLILLNLLK
jgi:hypothetical protein